MSEILPSVALCFIIRIEIVRRRDGAQALSCLRRETSTILIILIAKTALCCFSLVLVRPDSNPWTHHVPNNIAILGLQVGLCLIGTCVILKCHFANPSIKPMPSWVREIFLHYVGGLLLNRPKPNGSMQDDQKDLELDTGYLLKPDAAENGYDDNDNGKHDHRNSAVWTPRRRFSGRSPRQARNDMPGDLDLVQSSCPVHTSDAVTSALLSKQGVIAKNLDQMARAQSEHEKHEREKGEWMFVAAVLDRLFLMVFLIILVVSACVLYTRIPNHGT